MVLTTLGRYASCSFAASHCCGEYTANYHKRFFSIGRALFFLTDIYAFTLSFFAGIVDLTLTIYRTIPLVIVLPLGVAIGIIGINFLLKVREETYRKFVFYFLIVISVFGITKVIDQYLGIKKTSAVFTAEVYKINYYLCFLVLNLPPLTSFSKKEPKASPTSVKVTPVAPS